MPPPAEPAPPLDLSSPPLSYAVFLLGLLLWLPTPPFPESTSELASPVPPTQPPLARLVQCSRERWLARPAAWNVLLARRTPLFPKGGICLPKPLPRGG